ncbi:MAG: alpha-L-rhamnosidase [Spirochaetes bacterium]|nr:alpha-L-rhamnosidase [Spirochaetota bacterium]
MAYHCPMNPAQPALRHAPAAPPFRRELALGKTDLRTRLPVWPKRILMQSEGKRAPRHGERLLTSREGQSYVHFVGEHASLPPGGAILLDFGMEIHGSVRLVTPRGKPAPDTAAGDRGVYQARLRFGESVGAALGSPVNDHSVHDTLLDIPAMGSAESSPTGFRFLHLEVPADAPELPLLAVHAVLIIRDLPWTGSFRSSDERLNRIWEVGAWTVQLNMQEHLWDGIHRDRLVWMGDLNPEIRTVAAVFDDTEVVESSLDFVRDRTPGDGWMNTISTYSAWWVINLYEWHLARGRTAYLESQRHALLPLLERLRALVGPDGAENFPPMRFLDWPSHQDAPAVHAGLQGLLCLALRAGRQLCAWLGEPTAAESCARSLAEASAHRADAGTNKQAHALQVLSGLEDAAEIHLRVFAPEPERRLSTFLGFYVLQAMAEGGGHRSALEAIRKYWGGMLDFGATSFWEDFDLEWTKNACRIDELPVPGKRDLHADFGAHCYVGLRHSLCHGWAGGPTAWLSERILGVRPTAPGFSRAILRPELGDLEWVEGTVPTPHGPIKIRVERGKDGGVLRAIEKPEEIAAEP